MKHNLNKFRASLILCPLMMVSAALLCITLPLAAQASPASSADIAMTLISSDTISQGEPVVLRYQIRNLSIGEKDVFTLPDGHSWVTIHVTDAAGNTISTSPAPQRTGGTISTDESLDLFGNSSQEGYFVPSLLFPTLPPGVYTLFVHAELTYGSPIGAKPMPKGDPGRVIRDFTFPLTITPADTARLESVAATLRQAIQKDPAHVFGLEPKHMLFQSLLSMPASIAGPSWDLLAKDSNQSDVMATELLNLP